MGSIHPWRQAIFETSAAEPRGFPPLRGAEIAFVGRSNSGKSSAINALCGQKSLARSSRTPGRTRLVNFFRIDEARRLVDLPGYGFARAGREDKQRWQWLIGAYLESREALRGLVLVMDIRHPLTAFDRGMVEWAATARLPLLVLLSKADKLSRGAASGVRQKVSAALREFPEEHEVVPFSATRGTGVDDALVILEDWMAGI